MALEILPAQYNPVLRRAASRVPKVDAQIKALIYQMLVKMAEYGGVGLAAPQCGIPWRVITIGVPRADEDGNPKNEYTHIRALCNPKIIRREGSVVATEGCLSLSGIAVPVARAEKVTVTAIDEHGKKVTIKASGLEARILQHEIDHLAGRLILDYMTEEA